MSLKDAQFILALILVLATTGMVYFALVTESALEPIMATFGVLTVTAVSFYFGSHRGSNGS